MSADGTDNTCRLLPPGNNFPDGCSPWLFRRKCNRNNRINLEKVKMTTESVEWSASDTGTPHLYKSEK